MYDVLVHAVNYQTLSFIDGNIASMIKHITYPICISNVSVCAHEADKLTNPPKIFLFEMLQSLRKS